MAIEDIVLLGDPLLREQSEVIRDFDSPETLEIKANLKRTLLELQGIHKKGGGLAAPQLGYLKRIVFLNAKGRSLYLINPVVTEESDELFDVWDFCFSAKAAFIARIKRHKRIRVEYQDEQGQKQIEQFEDYWSELVHHEIDHLNGKLFIDLIDDPKTIAMMDQWNRKHPPTGA